MMVFGTENDFLNKPKIFIINPITQKMLTQVQATFNCTIAAVAKDKNQIPHPNNIFQQKIILIHLGVAGRRAKVARSARSEVLNSDSQNQ